MVACMVCVCVCVCLIATTVCFRCSVFRLFRLFTCLPGLRDGGFEENRNPDEGEKT